MNFRVGVKFCGHCNPARDMWQIYKDLTTTAGDGFDVTLLSETDENHQYDCCVMMNACSIACATEAKAMKHCVRVEPDAVDGIIAENSDIVDLILNRIKDKCAAG